MDDEYEEYEEYSETKLARTEQLDHLHRESMLGSPIVLATLAPCCISHLVATFHRVKLVYARPGRDCKALLQYLRVACASARLLSARQAASRVR